jgi:DNA polymerase-3 subunit delta
LPQWLAGRLKAQKQDADNETLEFIAERVEGNLMAAFQEVQKLALLAPPGRLEFEAVRDAVLDVARYNVFDAGEVMLEGNPLRIARTIEGLRSEGVAAPLVLWALSEEIRVLAKIVSAAADGRPIAQLVRDARVRGATHQSLMQEAARKFPLERVTDGLRHAAAIDRMVKGLDKGDVWDELLQLALRFSKAAIALSS